MRNLKKVLALVLALVMSLSLVTIANAADFSDDADINYDEAVDVMVAAGIIDGVGNNSFDPNGTLTREQAAKLVTYMLMGENAEKLGVESSSFKDVAVTRWSAPAIEYCASLGIIDGAGDGNFYPAGRLTGFAFAKMLLTALGYDSDIQGFTGNGWTINVAALGMDVGLDDGLEKTFGSAELTRQEAAQMALNAIKAPLVEYDSQANININGTQVNIGGQKAEYVTTTIAKEQRIGREPLSNTDGRVFTVEFGERYLPKLELIPDTDDFLRPTYTWSWDKKDIGTYVDSAKLYAEWSAKVEYQDIYAVVGSNAAKNFNVYSYLDGADTAKTDNAVVQSKITRNNDDDVPETGRGVLTQVFVDTENEDIIVTRINTYLAQASTDYNSVTGKISLTVYNGRKANGTTDSTTKRLDDADFPEIKDLKEDDFVTVNMTAKGDVVTLGTPEIVSDVTVTSHSSKPVDGQAHVANGGVTKIVANGATYNNSYKSFYDAEYLFDYNVDDQLKDSTYDLILDQYGYLLGLKNVTKDENFFFIVGYEVGSNVLAKAQDKALVIFPDGTMQTVNAMEKDNVTVVASSNGNVNAWYNYSINSDGVYVISGLTNRQFAETRTDAGGGSTAHHIDSKNTTMATTKTVRDNDAAEPDYVYGNASSVYITVDTDDSVVASAKSIVEVLGVSTGIKNTSIVPIDGQIRAGNIGGGDAATKYNVFALYNKSGYVTYAIVIGEDGSVNDRFVYLTSGITSRRYDSKQGEHIYSYDAIINGEMTEVEANVTKNTADGNLAAHNLYKASYNADGIITKMELMGQNAAWNTKTYQDDGYSLKVVASGAQKLTASGAVLYLTAASNNQYIIIDENAKFFVDGKDDTDGEYNEYPSIDAALTALGKDSELTAGEDDEGNDLPAKVVAICDKTTGFGTTIILKDYVYESDGDSSENNVVPAGTYDIDISDPADVIVLVDKDAEAALKTERAALNQVIAAIRAEGWDVADGAATKSGDVWTIKATDGAISQDFKWDANTDFDSAAITVNVGGSGKLMGAAKTIQDLGDGEYAKVSGSTSANNGFKAKGTTLVDNATYDIGYYEVAADDSNNTWNLKTLSGTGVVNDTANTSKYYAKKDVVVTVVMDQDAAADLLTTATVSVTGLTPTTKAVSKAGKTGVAATATIDVADADKASATIGSNTGVDLTANATGTDSTHGYSWSATEDTTNGGYDVTVTRTGDHAYEDGTVDGMAFTGAVAPVKAEITITFTMGAANAGITAVATS